MYVDPNRSNWVVEHAGKDYFFCSEACQLAFAYDSEKFLRVGVWGQVHGNQMGSMGGCFGVGMGNGWRWIINTVIWLILILLLIFSGRR